MREIVCFFQDVVYAREPCGGLSEEALEVGVTASCGRGCECRDRQGRFHSRHCSKRQKFCVAIRNDDCRRDGPILALALRRSAQRGGLIHTLVEDGISVAAALSAMADRRLSCVAVLDGEARAVGVFTTRDYFNRVLSTGADATRVRV